MATSTFPATGGFVDNTSAATFVPEIWSDEIRAAYEKNLILANLVKKMSMSGKKGDTIHIPAPIRGAAYAKAENTAVTVQNNTESQKFKLLLTSTTSTHASSKILLKCKLLLHCVTSTLVTRVTLCLVK
jgi:hypothetical protein